MRPRHDFGMRHPEATVAGRRGDAHRRPHPGQEGPARRGAASVVRECEHVGLDGGAGERGLAGRLHVARKEHPASRDVDAHHERAIVARARRLRRRTERRHHELAEVQRGSPGRPLLDGDPSRTRGRHQLVEGGIREAARRQPEAIGRKARQHRRQPAPMIEVRVGGHHQTEASYAERRERRRHHGFAEVEAVGNGRAAVHQHRVVTPLHQEGSALPHVEGDEARRRRVDCGRRCQCRTEGRRQGAGHTPSCRGGAQRGERGQRGEAEQEARGPRRQEGTGHPGAGGADHGQREPRRGCSGGEEHRAQRPGGERRRQRGGQT